MARTDPEASAPVRLTAGNGARLELLRSGARVHRLVVPDADGRPRDVVLGHRTAEEYVLTPNQFGATIGRYANRIARGELDIGGVTYRLPVNDRGHHLHGGPEGWDSRAWTVRDRTVDSCTFGLISPDGDAGYPGEVRVEVRYAMSSGETADGSAVSVIEIDHTARTDATTVVAMTNHTYFNLDAGTPGYGVDDHLLTVPADRYTPTDELSIPTGEIAPVDGTPFDFRAPARVGERVRVAHPQVVPCQGVDHNLVIADAPTEELHLAATLTSPRSGLTLTVESDQPGLQVYTGNFLGTPDTPPGRNGEHYRQGDAICLEPQIWPDAPHHAHFPSAVLRPDEEYRSRIRWTFTTG